MSWLIHTALFSVRLRGKAMTKSIMTKSIEICFTFSGEFFVRDVEILEKSCTNLCNIWLVQWSFWFLLLTLELASFQCLILLGFMKITSFETTWPKNTILCNQNSDLLCWAWSYSWRRIYNTIHRCSACSLSLWK